MGKYMRKNKTGGAVVDISLGVRTRARTLALEQQQGRRSSSKPPPPPPAAALLNFCYLELRSRKLEKVFGCDARQQPLKELKRQRRVSVVRSEASIEAIVSISRSNSFTSSKPSPKQQQTPQLHHPDVEEQVPSSAAEKESSAELRAREPETSCGDNAFDHDANSSRDSFGAEFMRRVRESTPVCNDATPTEPPGSSSRPQRLNQSWLPAATAGAAAREAGVAAAAAGTARTFNTSAAAQRNAPTQEEIDDFFAQVEESEPKSVCDRYNYDFLNDVPLPGRFEWTMEGGGAAAAAAAAEIRA